MKPHPWDCPCCAHVNEPEWTHIEWTRDYHWVLPETCDNCGGWPDDKTSRLNRDTWTVKRLAEDLGMNADPDIEPIENARGAGRSSRYLYSIARDLGEIAETAARSHVAALQKARRFRKLASIYSASQLPPEKGITDEPS